LSFADVHGSAIRFVVSDIAFVMEHPRRHLPRVPRSADRFFSIGRGNFHENRRRWYYPTSNQEIPGERFRAADGRRPRSRGSSSPKRWCREHLHEHYPAARATENVPGVYNGMIDPVVRARSRRRSDLADSKRTAFCFPQAHVIETAKGPQSHRSYSTGRFSWASARMVRES